MQKVKPKKALGQHFLTDKSVAERIAATLDRYKGNGVSLPSHDSIRAPCRNWRTAAGCFAPQTLPNQDLPCSLS